jgi:hypothetical protein
MKGEGMKITDKIVKRVWDKIQEEGDDFDFDGLRGILKDVFERPPRTRANAEKLKIGDRIEIWSGTDEAASGTVIETGYCAIKVKWDDELISIIHFNNMRDVVRL